MAWFLRDRRGAEWKQGWTVQTLSSISTPPPPLLVVFAIVLLFLSLSKYMDYKSEMQKTEINFELLLFLLPVLLILIVRCMSSNGSVSFWLPRPNKQDSIAQVGNFPWGVAALVVVLLVMISYQSSFKSQWFRPLWKSY
ncbi:transmembrane protein [Thalictrum thalictroides]|uniref:Transmembrane protein n=1 Tax=Thalictrum thalictroides TaxID=46969 RepID=A0A7J6VE55_THATH|nr:transmembrane protein [Thalictrum thalictroides]